MRRGVQLRRRRSKVESGGCTQAIKSCTLKCSASRGRAGSGGEVCAGTPRPAPPQGLGGRRGLLMAVCCQLLSAFDGRQQGQQEEQCCRRCSSIAWTGARVPSGRAALVQGTATRPRHACQLTSDFLSKSTAPGRELRARLLRQARGVQRRSLASLLELAQSQVQVQLAAARIAPPRRNDQPPGCSSTPWSHHSRVSVTLKQ